MKEFTPGNDRLRSLERGLRRMGRGVRLYGRNGSWRALYQIGSLNLRRLAGRSVPQTVFLAPTYRCQCNCPNCYADESSRKNSDEISTEELRAWIGQVKAIGAVHLNFTCGEPLLREDIFELVAQAHEIGLLTRLSTNGFLLSRNWVTELRRAGLNQCGIAIDDADRNTHDRLLGRIIRRDVLGDMRNEALADIWKRHADGLRMVGRGICPMTQTVGREAFREHADRVFPGKRGKG